MTSEQLNKKADFIRSEILNVCCANGAGHIASSLSCVDILTALYYSVMNLHGDKDRLVVSKAHGAYGLYAILADMGILPEKHWKQFYLDDVLSGCIERRAEWGLEMSTGALGHGLPLACGMAYAAKLTHRNCRIFCLCGDGEMQEGSCWEAMQFAAKHKLNNLTLIIDANGLQAMDFIENVLASENSTLQLQKKCSAFGFNTVRCGGHNIHELQEAFTIRSETPVAILAETVKGWGVPAMENIPKFHFRVPTEEERRIKRYE